MRLNKDEILDRLAEIGNVAQFVAFRPQPAGLAQSTARVAGYEPNHRFASSGEGIAALLASSGEASINIRSYLPDDPRSREFVYGVRSVTEALGHLQRLAGEGLHLIVNETIDIHDGGVSGVAEGAVIEFAPDDTPRAVEKPDVTSLPRAFGIDLLTRVYGFAPDLPADQGSRVEFSIHPLARGWRQQHTLLWEIEPAVGAREAQAPRWPNRFSRHIGDKCFGLIVADRLGVPVPFTTVVARRVAPFSFGRATGSLESWIRTCPRDQQPGRFTTAKGWLDPFRLLAEEDPGDEIASVLSQSGVKAKWSGAAIVGAHGELIVEGTAGEGDSFMLGVQQPEPLPAAVVEQVAAVHRHLAVQLGPVRIEWVHDGDQAWVVQLHVGQTLTSELALVAGEATEWRPFDVSGGLVALRAFIAGLPHGTGILLNGDVGLTSHVADVVRKAGRPARIVR